MNTIIAALGGTLGVVIVVLILTFVFLARFTVVQEYERVVVFRFGRLGGVRGPGIIWYFPLFERIVKVDIRVVTLEIPEQEVITRDTVQVSVNAVAYYRVIDPGKALVAVQNYTSAAFQVAQTALRSVLGQFDLDSLLAERDKVNDRLRTIIDQQTEPWGIQVSAVEVKDVKLPDVMQRAMARQGEAERERRAKMIDAEAEESAAQALARAATTLALAPGAMELRRLQVLTTVATDNNTVVLFPLGDISDVLNAAARNLGAAIADKQ